MDYSNKILIICTTFNFPKELSITIHSLLNCIHSRNDIRCIFLDNLSKDQEVHQQLDTLNHPHIKVIKNTINYGKAIAVNTFIEKNISLKNCPRIIISMDPDLKFNSQSLNKLILAMDTIPKLGMLAMSYIKNQHNPERSLWLPAKKIKTNNHIFKIKQPVFANVAGGLFAIHGYVLSHYLQFKLFPKTKNEENIKKGYVKRAGSVDAYLYDTLKKYNLIQGYLQETEIEHLKTPPQTENYIK